MKNRIPFPYGLWREITLTYSPKFTVFMLLYGLSAFGAAVIAFEVAKERMGLLAGFIAAPGGLLVGYAIWHLVMRSVIGLLKVLVRKKVMEDPELNAHIEAK